MNKIFLKFFGLRRYTHVYRFHATIHDFFHAHHVYYVICITHIHPLLYLCSWLRILPRMLYLLQEINCVALEKKTMNCVDSLGNQNRHGAFWEASHVNASIRHQHENPINISGQDFARLYFLRWIPAKLFSGLNHLRPPS